LGEWAREYYVVHCEPVSTSSENDGPPRVERITFERIAPKSVAVAAALDSTGALWVSFAQAWMSKIERDGLESARALTPRTAGMIACDTRDNVLALCTARDAWERRSNDSSVACVAPNGVTRWETRVPATVIYGVAVDPLDRLLMASTSVLAVTEAGVTTELPNWCRQLCVDPITKRVWLSNGAVVWRVEDLAMAIRGGMRSPAPLVYLVDSRARARANVMAPCDDSVWMTLGRAPSDGPAILRRAATTRPSDAPKTVMADVPFLSPATAMVATVDGGFWAALENGDLVKCDTAGRVTSRVSAAEQSGAVSVVAPLQSLSVTPDGRTAAALSFAERAVIRVTI
jgi:hypothetical protein